MRWVLLSILIFDALMPFAAAFMLRRLLRLSWPCWKAYGLVSTVFVAWTLVVMHGVGYNLTSYVVIVPVAVVLGSARLQVRDSIAVALLTVIVWVIVPTAISWLYRGRRTRPFNPPPP